MSEACNGGDVPSTPSRAEAIIAALEAVPPTDPWLTPSSLRVLANDSLAMSAALRWIADEHPKVMREMPTDLFRELRRVS